MNYGDDATLSKWINQYYLDQNVIDKIKQGVLSKPTMRYAVLDDFFRDDVFDLLVESYNKLSFSEEADRRAADGSWLPYDSEVCFANSSSVGADLFFSNSWQSYCANLVLVSLDDYTGTDVKLRHHRSWSDGFWIHTDDGIRQMVAICYFNKNWAVSDGGLLQLWRVDDCLCYTAYQVESPSGKLFFLSQFQRIQTGTAGGSKQIGVQDFVLVDQIVPEYNRLFLCNFQTDPCYHSVTPSAGRDRFGFVQWFGTDSKR